MQTGEGILENLVCEASVEIKNAEGLHMRPAMKFVDLASQFECEISVSNDEMKADAKSIMEMSMLAATYGTRLSLKAEGPQSREAVKALKELVEVRLFDEPPPEGAGA
ncbi:MAG: HPr family phosphocarrier protein [Sedimentisphaerales bacterium]|nr:HPr family phosphocarrier protein [Sedimentisphaerales bacterium]